MLKTAFLLVCVHVSSTMAAIPFNCTDMTPNNISDDPQTGTSPYDIFVNVEDCNPTVTVTLNGTTTFAGFLCQARTASGTPLTSGTFTSITDPNAMRNDCPFMTSLNNIPNNAEPFIQFTWDPAGSESVKIVCTVVQDLHTYWMNLASVVVEPSCDGTTTTESTGTTTTESTGTTTTESTGTTTTESTGTTTTESTGTTTSESTGTTTTESTGTTTTESTGTTTTESTGTTTTESTGTTTTESTGTTTTESTGTTTTESTGTTTTESTGTTTTRTTRLCSSSAKYVVPSTFVVMILAVLVLGVITNE